jgi:glutamate/tyrosine decarboxylase-like PLP-dependent enzyme
VLLQAAALVWFITRLSPVTPYWELAVGLALMGLGGGLFWSPNTSAAMNGAPLPDFDFRVPGVCSISADLHKFGYAAKGASTVLYREARWRDLQVFRADCWPNGMMETPTLAGTRPGGSIASAYAVMNFLGVEGYRAKAKIVTDTREKLEAGVRDLGFVVRGQPHLAIFTFGHDRLDPLAVGERLYARGWFSGRTREPRGIHMMLSPGHALVADQWLEALAGAVDDVRKAPTKAGGAASYT